MTLCVAAVSSCKKDVPVPVTLVVIDQSDFTMVTGLQCTRTDTKAFSFTFDKSGSQYACPADLATNIYYGYSVCCVQDK